MSGLVNGLASDGVLLS